MAARSPQELNDLFVDAMNAGDLDRALSCWTPDTVFVVQPGTEPVRGWDNLRQALKEFIDTDPKLEVEELQRVEADDIAFVSLRWSLEGTAPDGSPISMSAVDGNVFRRQDDGTWKIVIDNPFHSEHVGFATASRSPQ